MLESSLTLEQIAAAWLELWTALQRCGNEVVAARDQGIARNSRKPVGKALVMAVDAGPRPDNGDMVILTFAETRAAKGDDAPGYLLSFLRTGANGEDEPRLSAEIDIRGEWLRGSIVGINQGRESYSRGLVVNGNIAPVVRLIDPWQQVYRNLTSGITDAQRFLLAREAVAVGGVGNDASHETHAGAADQEGAGGGELQ